MIKKLNNLGYTKVELLVIIVLLGVVAFVAINKTSYAFATDEEQTVKELVNIIEIQAEYYAMDNISIFDESNTAFITVNDLVTTGYLLGDDNGLITNPNDDSESYNSYKIKLEYDSSTQSVDATLVN